MTNPPPLLCCGALVLLPNSSHLRLSTPALFWEGTMSVLTGMANNYQRGNAQQVKGCQKNTALLNSLTLFLIKWAAPLMTTCQVELYGFCLQTKPGLKCNNHVCIFFLITFKHFPACLNYFTFFYPKWDVLICPDWWRWKQAVRLLPAIAGTLLKCSLSHN